MTDKALFLTTQLFCFLISLTVTFFFISGCNSGGGSNGVDDVNYTLNGAVEYKGKSISNVKVVLGGDKSSETTTGQDGSYSFKFKEGSYSISFYSDDYLFERQGFSFEVFDFYWIGGPGYGGGSNIWGAGKTMTANWEASLSVRLSTPLYRRWMHRWQSLYWLFRQGPG